MNKRLDLKLGELPPMAIVDAAWIAGIAREAMEKFVSENNLPIDRPVTVTELLHTAFHLLGYKQIQVDLLTRQLHSALSREQELSQALQSRLGILLQSSPDETTEVSSPPSTKQPAKIRLDSPKEKKKDGKKRKKEAFF
ncbi:MAG: hypothetical protein HW380_1039 [Magnetococcales bacterium]|nr:hypothetical protein [Magnetococcales bacterium]